MGTFSEKLKTLRSQKGLTLKSVAEQLNIGLMAYAHYEYGDREPSLEVLKKLCILFDVSADYLIGLSDY